MKIMSSDYNKVIIIGRLTRDPELRLIGSGMSVLDFSIASSESYKNDGKEVERTSFVDITAFGKQAEIIAQYLTKGRKILVEGSLRQDKWEDKNDGSKRSKLYVVLKDFSFIDSPRDSEESVQSDKSDKSDQHEEESKPTKKTTNKAPF